MRKLIVAGTDRAKRNKPRARPPWCGHAEFHEFWRLRFNEREAEIRSLEELLPSEIRFRTQFRGKRKAFEEFLRTIMRGSGLQGTVYEDLGNSFADGRELYQSRLELDRRLSEAAAAKVKLALLDNLVDFLVFRTPDITEILYEGKPLGEYSLGQRATVILHILMHLRRHPVIIIDQPEDDLDNETLYSHFISQLLERKEKTQFIFATHNANIPVLGDCDQAIVCRNEAGTFSFEHSIDDKAIQNRIRL
ncbi:MAG: ATP-binding protein [Acidobacteria bacterium]|nr:ATP-binding protein [Acidobacteriota bacterium]